MTKEEAIEKLKQAKNVKEWNTIRDSIKDKITMEELTNIDSSGLIVQVLGKDVDLKHQSERV